MAQGLLEIREGGRHIPKIHKERQKRVAEQLHTRLPETAVCSESRS